MFDGFEVGCATRTIYGEARGEGPEGMKAVAHVILNRAKDGRWGVSLGAVCLAPWQFSCWNNIDPNRQKMLNLFSGSLELSPAEAAFGAANAERQNGIDPTGGATHYANLSICSPAWVAGATKTAQIGAHTFFKHVA